MLITVIFYWKFCEIKIILELKRTTLTNHWTLSRNKVTRSKINHRIGAITSAVQNILESAVFSCISLESLSESSLLWSLLNRFSKTQWLLPSSSTVFHHRSPANSLPVTFFTVQKSTEISNINKTNIPKNPDSQQINNYCNNWIIK